MSVDALLEVYVDVEVRDSSGRLLKRLSQPAKSWVANFARVLRGFFLAKGNGTTTATSVRGLDGVIVDIWVEWYDATRSYRGGGTAMAANAPDNNDSFGIVVGNGTTPVTYDDFNLESKIPHGTGQGQLDYDTHTFTDVTVDTSTNTASFRFSRKFKNLSGAPVTVSEVGIIAHSHWKYVYGVLQDIKYLIARDVLSQPVEVPDGGSLTVTYTFKVVP